MNRNIVVEESPQPAIGEHNIEIVMRKGIGHPDTLADGISEEVSRALSKEYLERFGDILHHNTDKVLLVGGSANPEFGGGDVGTPIYVVKGGRGTTEAGGEEIPVDEIAERTTYEFMDKTVKHIDTETDVSVDSRIGSGSVDLRKVFDREGVPSSNDTSIGIGYAPLSETEKLVLKTEEILNSGDMKKDFPEIGEDIKVMAWKENDHIDLTVAIAMVSKYIDDLDYYISLVEEIQEYIRDFSEKITEKPIDINVNAADSLEEGVIYQTVTGTSAEQGDDGMTGRGNRVNGLISFDRPMSLEATAGKNPVNHVGKLYNILSMEVAQEISDVEGVSEVFVKTLSQIGHPINRPKIMNLRILPEEDFSVNMLKSEAEGIAKDHLNNIQGLTKRIVEGKVRVC
ncbi:S-adenosylmethionine synthetase [candidate division MSBL1 archaeon SCGC-AAA259J03]|uniref:S-adenosylmethionine synthetase n=1 Tax=candidate division MSBL1 archaeon SCGC-AAA259J03 TaxID=1698269 RepID=A0A656YX60_9EURY|nr:S-adenosylmethionine synthetase [candidate division MSBL1 archaeon SCGC-AAA259J03]